MKNKGFTLIELMAVIVLLAILSTGSITLIMKSMVKNCQVVGL